MLLITHYKVAISYFDVFKQFEYALLNGTRSRETITKSHIEKLNFLENPRHLSFTLQIFTFHVIVPIFPRQKSPLFFKKGLFSSDFWYIYWSITCQVLERLYPGFEGDEHKLNKRKRRQVQCRLRYNRWCTKDVGLPHTNNIITECEVKRHPSHIMVRSSIHHGVLYEILVPKTSKVTLCIHMYNRGQELCLWG